MSAQSLKMAKGVGAFIIAGTQLAADSTLGDPYPGSVGLLDFTPLSSADKDILASSNHPTVPQHNSSHPTAAFLYSAPVE